MRRLTTESFIEKAKEIHGDKYDYSKVDLNNRDKKGRVCIICPTHGEYWQLPSNHLQGKGCKGCIERGYKYSFESILEKAKKVHNGKYTYDKYEFNGLKNKGIIICPKHGEFEQSMEVHLKGHGCPKCAHEHVNENNTKTLEEFINKAKKIHNNKYDYSKVVYINCHEKICIVCPIHGEFWQMPHDHLREKGCPTCGGRIKKTCSSFIEEANKVHNNRYDYSKVEYVNNRTKVCIICPKHGEFWQRPDHHLKGVGCPLCNESKLEKNVNKLLSDNGLSFERQKRFDWLGLQSLDFYLPNENIAIECQGIQHYKKTPKFGNIEIIKQRDKRKKQLCEEHNIKLLYFADEKYEDDIIVDKNELLEKIKNI